ncbi:MAG: sel1 repeat family protein [Methylobacteriaceae bacterium]|nr:sel1 repeat family protein [Methylobacteriaceae bacterium]
MRSRAPVLAVLIAALALFAPTPAAAQQQTGVAQAKVARALALFRADAMERRRDGRIVFGPETGADGEREARRRQAREWLREAATAGEAQGRELYGKMLEYGVGGEAQPTRARALYADAGTRLARWRLGRMLEQGRGGPKDMVSARRLYRLASKAGQIDAAYDHARLLRAGLGGPKDPIAARAELERTTGFCHGDAADELAEMAGRGEGGARDVELAATQHLRALGCRDGAFAPPAVLARWRSIERDVRIEIQRRLAAEGRYSGPIDGEARGATMAKALQPGR